jgi:hypothetical protein
MAADDGELLAVEQVVEIADKFRLEVGDLPPRRAKYSRGRSKSTSRIGRLKSTDNMMPVEVNKSRRVESVTGEANSVGRVPARHDEPR